MATPQRARSLQYNCLQTRAIILQGVRVDDPWKVRECEEAQAAGERVSSCAAGLQIFPEAELVVEPEEDPDSQADGAEDEQIAQ